jgi:ubiquitin-protein ligase
VSLAEAQAMLDEYDLDGGGTIDFTEFMVLIYRIQRGTVDLQSNDLARAMKEAKSQLRIFEEIEDVGRNPPAHCKVVDFGGAIVTCKFLIEGPASSPYRGGRFLLQMVFNDGYPFRHPDIKFLTRMFSVNILSQLDGDGRLMHIQGLWDAEWTIHKLLEHIVQLLITPDLELLPIPFKNILEGWTEQAEMLNIIFHSQNQQNISMTKLSNENIAKLIQKLSRVEQLHLNVIFMFLVDRDKYHKIVQDFSNRFIYHLD